MDNTIKIIQCDSKNINSYKVKLLQSFSYHTDLNRGARERVLLEETIKLVQKKKTILYILQKEDKFLGAITLSASSIDDTPVVQIDFLFVDYKYRKVIIEEIDDTVSNYLISFATSRVAIVQQTIGVKYLALYPDAQSDKLISHYKDMGFLQLNKEWLFIKID